jgi:hypothetical protein
VTYSFNDSRQFLNSVKQKMTFRSKNQVRIRANLLFFSPILRRKVASTSSLTMTRRGRTVSSSLHSTSPEVSRIGECTTSPAEELFSRRTYTDTSLQSMHSIKIWKLALRRIFLQLPMDCLMRCWTPTDRDTCWPRRSLQAFTRPPRSSEQCPKKARARLTA